MIMIVWSTFQDQDVMSLLGDDASDISQVSTGTNNTINSDASSFISSKGM